MQTEKGQSIEDQSMEIIEKEIGSHQYDKLEWPIVRRVIHATADFDFAEDNKIIFHKDAIKSGIDALRNGCNLIVDVIGVIGNAPTALLEIIQMIQEGVTTPALIIGIPVGFVSSPESKEALQALDIPFITNQGRKGGSPCASAIVNALFKLLRESSSS